MTDSELELKFTLNAENRYDAPTSALIIQEIRRLVDAHPLQRTSPWTTR
ncbi:MAG: hypothetical protein ACRDRS_02110 [Pseudonocardiaceae bacterium]